MLWTSVKEENPKSEDDVLLCCVRPDKTQYVCCGFYAAPKTIEGGFSDDCLTEYDEENDVYYLIEGFYESISNWDDYSSIAIGDTVTHWMPLPETPKEGE